jgi:hypothetical protein
MKGRVYAWRCSNFKHIGHGSRLSKPGCRKNLAKVRRAFCIAKRSRYQTVFYRAGNKKGFLRKERVREGGDIQREEGVRDREGAKQRGRLRDRKGG